MKYDGINPLSKLHPGEPYFFIRGQDILAPEAIIHYAYSLKQKGDEAGFKEVREIADKVFDWQLENPSLVKMPDSNRNEIPSKSQEHILRTIRYRTPDPIPNPETLSLQTLIDGDHFEKITVQFEFKYIMPENPNDPKVENPKWGACEYEPFFNAGEIVIRPRIRPAD